MNNLWNEQILWKVLYKCNMWALLLIDKTITYFSFMQGSTGGHITHLRATRQAENWKADIFSLDI